MLIDKLIDILLNYVTSCCIVHYKTEKMSGMGFKALVTGAVGAGIAMGYYGESLSNMVPLAGFSVPSPVAVGATTAVGSVVGDLATSYILPMIPGNSGSMAGAEGMAVGFAASGAAAMWAQKQWSGEYKTEGFVVGGLSNLAGGYLADKVYPLVGGVVNIF